MQISNPTKKQAGICYAQHTPTLHEKKSFYELDNDGFTIGSRDFGCGIFTPCQNTTESWLALEYVRISIWAIGLIYVICALIFSQKICDIKKMDFGQYCKFIAKLFFIQNL